LGDPILEYCQLYRFRSVSPEVINDQISIRLSCTFTRRASASLSRHTSAGIGRMSHLANTEQKQIKSLKDSHFMAFPRLSISSRRNFSPSVAHEALERASSTFAVTICS
jgi:hypothetical protein